MMLRAILVLAAMLLSGPALGQARPVVVADAWIRNFEGVVTVYFEIRNHSENPDRLLQVVTPAADKADLFRTRIRSSTVSYQKIDSLEVGAFDDVSLRPAGLHIRLSGVKSRLAVGDIVPLTLRFERSGTIEITARVSNQLLGNR